MLSVGNIIQLVHTLMSIIIRNHLGRKYLCNPRCISGRQVNVVLTQFRLDICFFNLDNFFFYLVRVIYCQFIGQRHVHKRRDIIILICPWTEALIFFLLGHWSPFKRAQHLQIDAQIVVNCYKNLLMHSGPIKATLACELALQPCP